MDYAFRFIAGGLIVSMFAILGDMLRPKSFAGLFAAAPSVALATLALGFFKDRGVDMAIEGHSMLMGAGAFFLYSLVVCYLLKEFRWYAASASILTLLLWIAVALGSQQLLAG
jgi:hypothetical protein